VKVADFVFGVVGQCLYSVFVRLGVFSFIL
jgi:hypothetical protein